LCGEQSDILLNKVSKVKELKAFRYSLQTMDSFGRANLNDL
jgi:hypothetical protein